DFHAFVRHLEALGVTIGFEKLYGGPFIPRTKPIRFATPDVEPRYLPLAKGLQELVGEIIRLSKAETSDLGPELSADAQRLLAAAMTEGALSSSATPSAARTSPLSSEPRSWSRRGRSTPVKKAARNRTSS